MRVSFESPANFGIVSHSPVPPPLFDPAPISRSATSERSDLLKNIYVGNLSYGTTEDSLRSVFEPYGAVDRVNIVTDRDSGQPRGFAFVEMAVDAEGDQAINALNGQDLDGRTLNVNEARPKTTGGGGRGGNGGGGGVRRNNRW